MPNVTRSGNELTDVTRIAALEGDGIDAGTKRDGSHGIWEATENVVLNGGFESDAAEWVIQGGAVLTQSAEQAKFGSGSGKVQTGVTTWAGIRATRFTVVAAEVWTVSAWIYRTEAAVPIHLLIYDQAANYVAGVAFATTLGWVRASKTFTVPAGDTGWEIRVQKNTSATDVLFYVDGVQAEEQPVVTPYVETDGAAATRTAARVRMPASLIDETQGWVAIKVRAGWASAAHGTSIACLFEWADSSAERIMTYFEPTVPVLGSTRQTGGAGGYANTSFAPSAAGELVTVVFAWTATQVKVSLNGAAFVAVANTNIPTLSATAFDIGTIHASAGFEIDSDILWFACGTGVMTDAQAAVLAAAGEAYMSDFAAAMVITALWHADDASYETPGTDGARIAQLIASPR